MVARIGIDFGGTIGWIENDDPFPHCISTLIELKNIYGAENIFIVSKAGLSIRDKILDWLKKHNFWEITGLLPDNVYFCTKYLEKAIICKELHINVFIDDHIKIISSVATLKSMAFVIWFNKDVDIKLIPKEFRKKIIVSNQWNKIPKIFSKMRKWNML
jgi:hypothetical protein